MVKKQVAMKSSGKGANVAAATSIPEKKTTSAPATTSKDSSKFSSRDCLPERGFKTSDAAESFHELVKQRGWESFIKHRGSYCIPIVREFYAGIPSHKSGKPLYYSNVRGKRVEFDASTINDEYLLEYSGIDFDYLVETADTNDMNKVKSRITEGAAVWEKCKPTEYTIKSKYLTPEASAWHLFVACSLLPTSHTTTIKKERMLAIDSILSGGSIDVGRIIAEQIFMCKNKETGNLFFPCLITKLCAKAEVKITEERKFPPGPIHANYKDRTKTQKETVNVALQEQFMQQQKAMWKFEKEKMHWEDMWFQQLANGQFNIPKPIFPDWVLGEEQERPNEKNEKEKDKAKTRQEKVTTRKPPTKKEKGKRVIGETEFDSGDETTEEEEVEKEVKEMEKNEEEDDEETESDEIEVSSEQTTQQRPPTTPPGPKPTPKEVTPTPTKSPTISPIPSPTHITKTPTQKSSPQKEPSPHPQPPQKSRTPSPQVTPPSVGQTMKEPSTEPMQPNFETIAEIATDAAASVETNIFAAGTKRKMSEIEEEEEQAEEEEPEEEEANKEVEKEEAQTEQHPEDLAAQTAMATIIAAATRAATIAVAAKTVDADTEQIPVVIGATKVHTDIDPAAAEAAKEMVSKTLAELKAKRSTATDVVQETFAAATSAEPQETVAPTTEGVDAPAMQKVDASAASTQTAKSAAPKPKKQKKDPKAPVRASSRLRSGATKQ